MMYKKIHGMLRWMVEYMKRRKNMLGTQFKIMYVALIAGFDSGLKINMSPT